MVYISKRRQLKYLPLIIILNMFAIACIGNTAYGMVTHILGIALFVIEILKTTMAFVGVHSWSQLKNERVYAYMSAVEASIIFVITLANGTGMLIDYVVLLVSAYYGFYLTIRYEAAKIVLHQLGIE